MHPKLNITGPQIRRLRFQRGLSQPQLVVKCQLAGWDITRDILANIELQRRIVRDEEILILARLLDAPLADLFPLLK